MNWFIIAAVCITYPLFGVGIYLVRNRLYKIQNFNYVVMAPIVLSFVIGIGILGFALINL